MTARPPAPRTGHPYHMHDAIYSQPSALGRVADENGASLTRAAARLVSLERVLVTGVGSSWHAALVGELLLARAGRLGHRARAVLSFELTGYWPPPDAKTGVIVVSHRGSGRYARQALASAKAMAGAAISVTGKRGDDGVAADETLSTVEQEASEAHTVSYTAAVVLLAELAARIGRDAELVSALARAPDLVAAVLSGESWEELARRFSDRRCYWVIGGGPNTATAHEGALKLGEVAGAAAIAYNTEQFLHGGWTALEPDDAVILIAPPGRSYERGLDVARAVREVGVPLLAIVEDGDRDLAALAVHAVRLPAIAELLSPILTVVPLQLLAYHLALGRGLDPDTLRGGAAAYRRARQRISL